MKTEEMADLLEGIAMMTDKHMSKQAVKDIRLLSSWLREFSGRTMASLCKSVAKAGDPRPPKGRTSTRTDGSKVELMVSRITDFLENRRVYEYSEIERLAQGFDKLTMAEIKAVGDRMEGPLAPKTKSAMVSAWRHWLEEIKSSSDEGAFHFSGAAGS